MCHGKQKFDCPECEMILNTADAVESPLQQEAQDGACVIKVDVLQLEKGNFYRLVGDGGCSYSEHSGRRVWSLRGWRCVPPEFVHLSRPG